MVDFLEYMVSARPSEASSGVYNTLLEHYLHQYDESEEEEYKKKQEEKVMQMLKKNVQNYDEDQALILCQRHSFHSGALFLYERRALYAQILNHYVSRGDVASAVRTCRRFGARDPDLWTKTLQFIAREGEAEPAQVAEVLDAVESNRLLSPLLIVQTLSQSSSATLKLARDYLRRLLENERARAVEDEEQIAKYAEETALLRESNRKLREEAVVIQATRCSACGDTLELPCVFFMCGCAFREQCLQVSLK